MVNATLKREINDRIYTLEMTGHAGYAKEGTDIVCAACSALAYAAYSTLVTFAEAGHCVIDEAAVGAQGEPELRLCVKAHEGVHDALVMTIFAVLAHGLEAVARKYPCNVGFDLINN